MSDTLPKCMPCSCMCHGGAYYNGKLYYSEAICSLCKKKVSDGLGA